MKSELVLVYHYDVTSHWELVLKPFWVTLQLEESRDQQLSVWLAQLLKALAAPTLVHSGEGSGSISGADNLDSGFQPFGVDKMSSSQYVDG